MRASADADSGWRLGALVVGMLLSLVLWGIALSFLFVSSTIIVTEVR
jgi:hypothetical protein